MRHSRWSRWSLVFPVSFTVIGCGHGREHQLGSLSPSGERIITEEAIARSGASTAWEVLKRSGTSIHFGENRNGPARMWRRGRSSILLNDAPLVFLDGVRVADIRILNQISARTIAQISILSGIDGTTYYGTNATGGVIRINTKNGGT